VLGASPDGPKPKVIGDISRVGWEKGGDKVGGIGSKTTGRGRQTVRLKGWGLKRGGKFS